MGHHVAKTTGTTLASGYLRTDVASAHHDNYILEDPLSNCPVNLLLPQKSQSTQQATSITQRKCLYIYLPNSGNGKRQHF